jgi:pimeloyl-ACP methyl ester carboxylesterase
MMHLLLAGGVRRRTCRARWRGNIEQMLSEEFAWRGRSVRWGRAGSGPAVVFCHGTPWSSDLWRPVAEALAPYFTVYLWDMPGYGQSSKHPQHRVSLDVQGELFSELLMFWGLRSPHVVAHDYGGAVALRAHLLHESEFASLALVDVVALRPWGSDFFRLVGDHAEVFTALPSAVHEGALRAYIMGASHRGLTPGALNSLTFPWLDDLGQAAFYRQIAEADELYTDQIEPLYPAIDVPVFVVWGRDDAWIPVDRAHRLRELIPGARLMVIEQAGHLIQLDQPAALTAALTQWLITTQ